MSSNHINEVVGYQIYNPSHQNKRKHSAPKTVSFCTSVTVYGIPKLPQWAWSTRWYNQDDLKTFKSKDQKLIRHMNESSGSNYFFLDNDYECTRGLESRTIEGNRRKSSNRILAANALFDEQDRQFDENKVTSYHLDFDSIADVYSCFTARAQREAYEMGLQDELYVRYCIVDEDYLEAMVKGNGSFQSDAVMVNDEEDKLQDIPQDRHHKPSSQASTRWNPISQAFNNIRFGGTTA